MCTRATIFEVQPDREFRALVEPHARVLAAHCYRMLGSLADADDAVQETLLRAWRGQAGFAERASLRTWLVRIATNVCLDELARRVRQPIAVDPAPPELWVDDAAAVLSGRESVALAFVAALQVLPPAQRAALLLRDVLGTSAAEAAEILELSVAATESALARARATLEAHRPRSERIDAVTAEPVLARYLRAWEAKDANALVALLREDATLTMPPGPLVVGRDAILALLAPVFAQLGPLRIVRVEVGGAPGAAAYLQEAPGQPFLPHAIAALELAADGVAALHTYLDPGLFSRFGLPPSL